jgi:hypothetical protein
MKVRLSVDDAAGCAHEHFHIDGCNIAVSSMECTLLPLAQRNLGLFLGSGPLYYVQYCHKA